MTHPTRRLMALCVLAAALVPACTDDDATTSDAPALGEPTAAEQDAEPREWLFSVQADAPSTYTAGTLVMPATSVLAFTDRPHRDSRFTSLESFAALWDVEGPDSFTEDPPNAVLTYWDSTGPDARPRSVVCEVNGDVSVTDGPAGRALSMGIRILDPEGTQLPANLERAALFVDDLPAPCGITPEDKAIVEFANSGESNDQITLSSQAAAGGGSELRVACSDIDAAPPGFQVALGPPGDLAGQTTCNGTTPWTVPATQLQASNWCTAGSCSVQVTVRNQNTGTAFSSTRLSIQPSTAAPVSTTHELNPALLPICPLAYQPVLDTYRTFRDAES